MASPTTSDTPTAAVRALRATLRGRVLAPGDRGFEEAYTVWNGAVQARPAVVARCADEQDVARAIDIARRHGLRPSVRAGGHDWAGRALRDGGLLIDLSAMRSVEVDLAARTAWIGGGTKAGDFIERTRAFGLAPVTGTVKAVGMAGLTLGGGYGLLAGEHGLALDSLVEARVVLADGRAVTASGEELSDLFWALRGGGGNFGVVTALRYRLHPVSTVFAGLLLYPLDQASAVLARYRELVADAPDALTVMAGFFCGPEGRPLLFLLPVCCGSPELGRTVMDLFDGIGKPVVGQVLPTEYASVLSTFDQVVVDGRHNEVGTRWLEGPSEETSELLIDAAARITSPYSGIFVHQFHGAASKVPVADTAFALRRDHLLVEVAATWEPSDRPGETGEKHRAWARELEQQLDPYALPGGYPNLLGPHEHRRTLDGFGPHVGRLLDIKERYDPDHVFSAVAALEPTALNPGEGSP
ncbi:FAD-binding oxidoreductase [Streptomyces sp. NPDC088794]|uniref:FAD-binding oxidoreductase n=1 Tax=Streptomyces sp. NPDC088794 TaxID=3365902 RepID=UPI003817F558